MRSTGSANGHREERFVAFRGLKLFVSTEGDGPPLLLINGLGGNLEMWAHARGHLARGSHVITFDAPGMGRSRGVPVVMPHPSVAWMLGRLLDELGHERVDVLGYSLGGVMAQQLAHSAPERVRRLALVGTSCGWGSVPPDLQALALIATPARYFSKRLYLRTSHILDGGDRFRDPQLARRQAEARNAHPPSLLGYAQQFVQGTTWTSLPWLRTVRAPTLVLSGACDRLVPPANGQLLAALLPHSRWHLLPREGHLMLFDQHSAGLELLSDFFWSPDYEASAAWRDGEVVEDDEAVRDALRTSHGAQPVKAFNGLFRTMIESRAARRALHHGSATRVEGAAS